MYEQFYHLRADPFALSPNPGFSFHHASYKKARIYMQFALSRGEGFLLVTGMPGTGKTTLVKELLHDLEMTRYQVTTLVSTQLEADDLLRSVAYSYGLDVDHATKAMIIQRLNHYFMKRKQNRLHTILIVDEAQDLSEPALEELRLLTNFEQDNKPLLQVFIVGQPSLFDRLGASTMQQFRQRITVAAAMKPLIKSEVQEYIQHRLSAVGWQNDPKILPDVYTNIYEYTSGIPRQINLFCTRLLLHGYVENRHTIDMNDFITVAKELAEEQLAMSHHIPMSEPAIGVTELRNTHFLKDSKNYH